MSQKQDYYDLLGVDKKASAEDIKKAYRQKAMKYHPDKNGGDEKAADMFKNISEAYEILSDPQKRASYDAFGHDGVKSSFGAGGFNFARDFSHHGMFSSMFEHFFNANNNTKNNAFRGPFKGRDVQLQIEIGFEEAVFGAKKPVRFSTEEDCKACKGTGDGGKGEVELCSYCEGRGVRISGNGFIRMQQTCQHCLGAGKVIKNPCTTCSGTWRVKVERKFEIKIPKGTQKGSVLAIEGMSEGGRNGGPPGDVSVIIDIKEHEIFKREGNNLYCESYVNPIDAILGGEIEVPSLTGMISVKIEKGTLNNSVLRLEGKGVDNGSYAGDLYVRVLLETPQNLTKEITDLFKKAKKLISEDNFSKKQELKEKLSEFVKKKELLEKA